MVKKKTTTKKAPDREYFKAPCPAIDQILRVKRLKPEEARKLYETLRDFVQKLDPDNAVTIYVTRLVKELLPDPNILKPYMDDETFPIVLKEVYDCIVDIYLFFRIEYICADINNRMRGSTPPSPLDDFFSGLETAEASALSGLKAKSRELSHPRNLKDLNSLENKLKTKIIGQDDAIKSLIRRSKLISVGFEKRGAFFFIGRTGMGKTELAKQFGNNFYGNFAKINCAEFANGHEIAKLIGAPPGYVGSNQKSFFTEKAEKSNKWVFLFDEIEKAHEKLYNVLLSLLDDGTITDSQGVTLDFSRSIFLFTSNQGISELKDKNLSFSKNGQNESANKEILKNSLDRQFTPEFRNRIDEFIYFNDLTREQAKKIAELNLKEYPVVITDDLLDYIVDHSFSVEFGVRELKRFIKSSVALPIAEKILNTPDLHTDTMNYVMSVEDGKLVVTDAIDSQWQTLI